MKRAFLIVLAGLSLLAVGSVFITSVDPLNTGYVTTNATTPSGQRLPRGTKVTLTAVPRPGYAFDYWSGDASETSPTIVVTLEGYMSFTAHFKRISLIERLARLAGSLTTEGRRASPGGLMHSADE